MPAPRTIVYVDGFNLHHRVLKPLQVQWLNIQLYFERIRADDDIRQIHYFTAPLTGAQENAHQAYVNALRTLPLVNVIAGVFQTQRIDCKVVKCTFAGDRRFFKYQEKRTDVNIALQMLDDAHRNLCDQLLLVSGDSDLVSAVKMVRQLQKKVMVYVPVRDEKRFVAQELQKSANMARNLPLAHLDKFQFAEEITGPNGNTIKKDPAW